MDLARDYARDRNEETGMHLTEQDLERMGLNKKGKWQYTVADVEALPEGVYAELIDGELFVWMEAPERKHQGLLGNLYYQIKNYIIEKNGKCEVYPAPFGVYIKKDIHNFVLPDIALICDNEKLDKKGCQGAPDLVIEVVSPSNRKMDYVRKLALYREAGVREYWIVDPKHEQVTVYDLEHGKEPVLHPFSERIPVEVYGDLYLYVTDNSDVLQELREKERRDDHAKGHAEGLAEGEARFARLTALLLREGRTGDLTRALDDMAYREELYQALIRPEESYNL